MARFLCRIISYFLNSINDVYYTITTSCVILTERVANILEKDRCNG